MMVPCFFEDYEVGSERESYGRTITETDIVLHAGQSGDFYPHHMDAEWAAKQPFGQRIAHGTLVFAVGIGLAAGGEINPEAFTYGYDRLRFVKPVFIGDTLRTRVRVREVRDDPKRPDMGFVIEAVEVLNQRQETVMACDHLLLVRRAPEGGAEA